MKKILFLLLCTVSIYGQTSTGQEQSFPYGIVNESLQTITTPTYIGTFGTDGTQGKIPSAYIAKTADVADSLATKENIANKSDSYTTSSSTTYASTKAIVDGLATKQNTLTNPITGTGTTGQVSFWNSVSTQTGDNGLFWNNINKKLGVGTISPSAKLHIFSGGGPGSGIIVENNASTGPYSSIEYKNSNGVVLQTGLYNNGDAFFYLPSTGNSISFYTSDISRLTVHKNGNVLIGTTTDDGTNKLQVNGSTKTTALTLATTPTTSAGTYDILTRNTSTGVVEKVLSSSVVGGTGTTNTIPKFTASGTVGNSSITDNGSLVSVNSLSEFKGTAASDGGQLGSELTTTATGTNWTGTGFATGYTHTTGDVTPLVSTLAAVTNNLYQITWTITGRTTGSVTINYGGIAISNITASGNSGPKTTSTATLNIVPTTDFNGTIVLSIKAISASVATITFKNSSGVVTNEIRAHSNNTNLSIGISAGRSITTGNNNSAVGHGSLANNTIGNNNSAVGTSALQNNTTGSYNNAIGYSSLQNNTTGSNNSAIGQSALQNNTTGNANSAVGYGSLQNNTTGGGNSAIGESAGRYIANKSTPATIVDNSIMLGYRTSPLADNQTNQVVIGYDATGLGSNSTVIGNSSTTTARVYGRQLVNTSIDNGTDQLQVNGTTKTTALTVSTAPTTSASTYDILTRNTSTGVVEKIASASGSYTPTLTNTTNVSSSTLNAAYYVRNGNIVTVTIAVQLTLTATTETVFTFSLPISGATVVSGIGQGNMTSGGAAVNGYGIVDITNSTTAQLRMGSTAVLGLGSGIANIMFTYSL